MDSNGLRRTPPPAFNVPSVVMWLIAVLVAVHLVRLYGPFSDEGIVYCFAFIPVPLGACAIATGSEFLDRGAQLWSFVTYSFIHADWLHLAMNCLWMLAFGSVVARRLGAARFLLMSGIGAAAGALMFYAFHPDRALVLVGASAAISAQVAVAARLMFAPGSSMRWSYDQEVKAMRPLSLVQTFTNRRSLMFIVVWLAINFVFGTSGFGPGEGQTPIAWEAHLGGFLAGLLIFGLIDRGNYRQ